MPIAMDKLSTMGIVILNIFAKLIQTGILLQLIDSH